MILKKLTEYAEFRACRKTMMETSYDDANDEYLSKDKRTVVDFDDVKTQYTADLGVSNEFAKSVDALFRTNDGYIRLVEFKNGDFVSSEIVKKVYDSLLIYLDITGQTITDLRENGFFTLVISEDKYGSLSAQDKRAMALANSGKQDFTMYGLGKMRGYLVKRVSCMSAERFSRYMDRIEIEL